MLPAGGTYYAVTCFTLRNMIATAYATNRMVGGGKELDTYYDLRATTPDGVRWTTESVRPMLQQLLADRFHLVLHHEEREVPGYYLIVAKGGTKMHSSAPTSVIQGQKAGAPSQNVSYPGGISGRGLTGSGIATLLSTAARAPVVDHTGLTGMYNLNLVYAPDNSTDVSLPSFFTAIEEQLGLKLTAAKVSVDTIVIDHVDQEPTAN